MKVKNLKVGPMEVGITLACVIAVMIYLGVYFYFMVPVDYYINKGPIREARSNPYYAAQQFLQARGIDSSILYSNTVLEKLQVNNQAIGSTDAIVLIQGRGVIHQKRFDALWPWLERGGTLVTSVVNPYFSEGHDEDTLFKELGVSAEDWTFRTFFDDQSDEDYPFEERSQDKANARAEKEKRKPGDEPPMPPSYLELFSYKCTAANIYVENNAMEGEELALKTSWGNHFNLEGKYQPTNSAKGSNGYAFADFEVGNGNIVINANNTLWENRNIACFDHARFLTMSVGDAKQVWFVVNSESPSFFKMVWKGVPLAIVAFAMALLLMLWRALVRFGPVYPDTRIERRHFSEHIRAAAGFLYRIGIHAELIENLRIQITRLMQRKNRHFDELTLQQKIQALEGHSDIKARDIEFAFAGVTDSLNRKEFVLMVKILKALKEQL